MDYQPLNQKYVRKTIIWLELVKKQKKINDTKKSAPGVPTNTCPYIDHAIAIIEELQDMHDELYEKGNKVPMFERKVDMLKDTLEYVRSSNETLRDNSLYWYNSYKKEAW